LPDFVPAIFLILLRAPFVQGQAREGAVRHHPCALYQPSRVIFYAGILQNSVVDPELFIPDPTSEKFRIWIRTMFSKVFQIKNLVKNFTTLISLLS
jgi:hypothetical protein